MCTISFSLLHLLLQYVNSMAVEYSPHLYNAKSINGSILDISVMNLWINAVGARIGAFLLEYSRVLCVLISSECHSAQNDFCSNESFCVLCFIRIFVMQITKTNKKKYMYLVCIDMYKHALTVYGFCTVSFVVLRISEHEILSLFAIRSALFVR